MSAVDPNCTLGAESRAYLLRLADDSVRHGLRQHKPLDVDLAALPPELTVPRATFVTLLRHGRLRGCIGTLEAIRPLAQDIAVNAYAAAFRDPRFPPLAEAELADLDIHLSLLTPAEPMHFGSEAELLAQIVPGRDGLILREGHKRGTFLPSVWESLTTPVEFLQHLKLKAGLPATYWSDTVEVFRYRTETIP